MSPQYEVQAVLDRKNEQKPICGQRAVSFLLQVFIQVLCHQPSEKGTETGRPPTRTDVLPHAVAPELQAVRQSQHRDFNAGHFIIYSHYSILLVEASDSKKNRY